jgi:diguanylate cyclase (GGDEF)-like protein
MDDHRRGGLPKGHPPLKAYLGLPIYSGSKLLGMAGVANRKGGYTEALTEEIKPFVNALGTLIAAHQNTASRIKAEETLFRTQQQLKEMATSDPVTGISNRYMVVQQLEMLFERTGRGENLAVLFLDVDHFKAVNDSHGHDVGDEVLKHIAAQISESLRPTDTVGRYGGEEFLIGLPECSVQDAQMIAERMRLKIAQSPFELPDGQQLSLSVSIGVAGSPHGWEDLSELIREGDQSMYAAKRAGRNCVVGG